MASFDFSVAGVAQKVCVTGSDDRFEIHSVVGGESVPFRIDGDPVFVGGSAGSCVIVEIAGDYRVEYSDTLCDSSPVFSAVDTGAGAGASAASSIPVGVDCDGNPAAMVFDACAADLLVQILAAITDEGDQTQAAIAALIATIDDGITGSFVLDGQPIDVNVLSSPVSSGTQTVELDAATLAALENTTVTVDGQPISVSVVGAVEVNGTVTAQIDAASVAAIAQAIAGETLTIDDADIIAALEASDDVLERVETTDCNGDPALNVTQSCEWRVAYFASGCDIVSGQIKYNTADGSVLSAIVTHDPSGVLAQGADASALVEIDPVQYPNGLPCAQDDVDNSLKVGQTTTVDASANDTMCKDFSSATYTVTGSSGVTPVNNGDGTFDITAAQSKCGGSWYVDYEVSCPEGTASARISGEIEDTPVSFDLSVTGATGILAIDRLTLSGAGTFDVTWPDGVTTTGHASNAINAASYDLGATTYNGIITVIHSSCSTVTRLELKSDQAWTVTDANLQQESLDGLTFLSLAVTQSAITDAGLAGHEADLTYLSLGNTLSSPTGASISLMLNATVLSLGSSQAYITDVDVSHLTNLTLLDVSDTPSVLSDSGVSPLVNLTYLGANNTASIITAASDAAGLATLLLQNTGLSQAEVDAHLAWFVANGPVSGRLDLRGTSTPSAAGLADQATLEAAGYRNTINGLPIV